MKRMKAEQKRKFAAVIAIILIVSMVLSAALPIFWASANAAPAAAQDYTIEAAAGFDGYAKIGGSIPVTAMVTNNSDKNFKGELSVLVMSGAESYSMAVPKYNQFAEVVEIASGGSKTISFNIPVKYIQREITIQLADGKDIVCKQEVAVSVGSDKDCMVAVLSDNPDSLSYLKPAYYSVLNGPVVDLTGVVKNQLVNTESVDVFVVNDYDLAALGEEQLREILSTVRRGNVMLLGEGSYIGSKELLGLEELTKAEIPVNDDTTYTEQYDISVAEIPHTGYKLGGGYIYTVESSLADDTIIGLDKVLNHIMSSACTFSAGSDAVSIENSLIGYTDRLPNFTDNTIKVIFAIIYIYIAFIPVLYVILKRKDKREKALKIIPALALGISVLIYLVSFNTVYKKPIASIINYVDLRCAGAETTGLKTYMNVISPSKGKLEIKPEGNPDIFEASGYNYNNYDNSPIYSDASKKEKEIQAKILTSDEGSVIEQNNKTKWSSTYLTLGGNYELDGNFEGNIATNLSGKFTGKLKNNTGEDFSEAVVIISSDSGVLDARKIDNLESGDSIDIDSFDIYLGGLSPKERYNFSDVINPNGNVYSRRKNLAESYRLETEQDIFDGVCGELNTGTDAYAAYALDNLKVTVLGFNRAEIYGGATTVNNKKIKASCINVFRDEFKVDFSAYAATNISYPSGTQPILESKTAEIIDDDNMLVYDINEYTELSFDNLNRSAFTITWDNNAKGSYIYNCTTNSWDELYNGFRYEPDIYTNDYGAVRVKAFGFTYNKVALPEMSYIN